MTCYHPLKGYRTKTGVSFSRLSRDGDEGNIELPCGRCIGCRLRRASDWSLRVMHESKLYDENCFVTLTYGRGSLPPNASLEHRDFQLFMKRLRKKTGREIRFYMCGEYGDERGRPHYHACLFNVDFRDRVPAGKSGSGELFYSSKELEKLWGYGHVSVQDLTPGTAAYCARYVMKKTLGEGSEDAYSVVDENTGEILYRKPPYAAMSLKPGIGARWLEKYGKTDVFAHDKCVQDGVERRVPKYYDRLLKKQTKYEYEFRGVVYDRSAMDEVQFKRQELARLSAADNTDERRAVREEVQLAKIRNQKRELL